MFSTAPVLVPEYLRLGWARIAAGALSDGPLSREQLQEVMLAQLPYQDQWRAEAGLLESPGGNIPSSRVSSLLHALVKAQLLEATKTATGKLTSYELTPWGQLIRYGCGVSPSQAQNNPFIYTQAERWFAFCLLIAGQGHLPTTALVCWPKDGELSRPKVDEWVDQMMKHHPNHTANLKKLFSHQDLHKHVLYPIVEPLRELGWVRRAPTSKLPVYTLTTRGQQAKTLLLASTPYQDKPLDWLATHKATLFCEAELGDSLRHDTTALQDVVIALLHQWPTTLDARAGAPEQETPLTFVSILAQAKALESGLKIAIEDQDIAKLIPSITAQAHGLQARLGTSSIVGEHNVIWMASTQPAQMQLPQQQIQEIEDDPIDLSPPSPPDEDIPLNAKQRRWLELVSELLADSLTQGHPLMWPWAGLLTTINDLHYLEEHQPRHLFEHKLGANSVTITPLTSLLNGLGEVVQEGTFTAQCLQDAWIHKKHRDLHVWFNKLKSDAIQDALYQEQLDRVERWLDDTESHPNEGWERIKLDTLSVLLDLQLRHLYTPSELRAQLNLQRSMAHPVLAHLNTTRCALRRMTEHSPEYLSFIYSTRWIAHSISRTDQLTPWELQARQGEQIGERLLDVTLTVNDEEYNPNDPSLKLELTANIQARSISHARAYMSSHRTKLLHYMFHQTDAPSTIIQATWKHLEDEETINLESEPSSTSSNQHIIDTTLHTTSSAVSCPDYKSRQTAAHHQATRAKLTEERLSSLDHALLALMSCSDRDKPAHELLLTTWAALEQLVLNDGLEGEHKGTTADYLCGPAALCSWHYRIVWLMNRLKRCVFEQLLTPPAPPAEIQELLSTFLGAQIFQSVVNAKLAPELIDELRSRIPPISEDEAWMLIEALCQTSELNTFWGWAREQEPWLINECRHVTQELQEFQRVDRPRINIPTVDQQQQWIRSFLSHIYNIRNAIAHDGWASDHSGEQLARSLLNRLVLVIEPVILDLIEATANNSNTRSPYELLLTWNSHTNFFIEPNKNAKPPKLPHQMRCTDKLPSLLRPLIQR